MSKTKLNYTEKHHFLEVDGIEYEIPQRTASIMQKIEEHDEDMQNHDEYENNIALLEILFGKEKVKQMFPEGKDANLDKLYMCVKYALALFNADLNKIQAEEINDKIKEMQPMLDKVSDVTQQIGKANDIVAVQRAKAKRKKK